MGKKYESMKGLSIAITNLCKKYQTWELLMDEPSKVVMFVKLCIYGSNPASVMPSTIKTTVWL